ncbi:hypothetical protein GO755_38545 [Spirosoma sp. HMF4905]|uniref:Lipoprotein n=1 Tax=Spirosoma arboris TaxID=2682092 RepID=A0A7K1SQC1_9BACT|nr:hypothetical protein [Spirosoma arboris]MVM35977.1 hypothetical protein [Spirosoma arboris]
MKKLSAITCLLSIIMGCHSNSVLPDQPVKATLLGIVPVPLNGECYALQLQIGEYRYATNPADFPSSIPYTVPGTIVYITYQADTTCAQFGGDRRYLIRVTSAHQ